MPSRADTHDLDKLNRWQKDLETTPAGAPPVFAVFLVSGEDRAAHNVFRTFRSSFEERNLGFAHLVIFGQHGVSETAQSLRAQFGLEAESGPSLVLISGDGSQPQIVSLPAGEGSDACREIGSGWREALDLATRQIDVGHKDGASALAALKEVCVELTGQN